jgi:hypothetical protein
MFLLTDNSGSDSAKISRKWKLNGKRWQSECGEMAESSSDCERFVFCLRQRSWGSEALESLSPFNLAFVWLDETSGWQRQKPLMR